MIKHSTSLKRKVEIYLKNLTKPQKAYGGEAICPGLKDYRHRIWVEMARDDLEDQLDQICYLLRPLDVPAAIIATALPPKNLYEITDELLNRHIDIEIFVNDPNRRGKIRNLYTGFEHGWLIIIQQKDLLDDCRENAKKTGYYGHNIKPE